MIQIPNTTGRILVTPQMAESWLAHRNANNRNISILKATRMAHAMVEGRFRDTHQGIAFDWNGNLQDGQHRLYAIVASEKAQWLWVFVDQDPANFTVIDTGVTRQTAQFLTGKHSHIRASAARIIYRAERGFSNERVPMDILTPFEESWEPELNDLAPEVKRVTREIKWISPSVLLAVAAQAAPGRNEFGHELDPFLEAFRHGSGQSTAVGVLIRKTGQVGMHWGMGSSTVYMPYRYTVMTWNAWVSGRSNLRFPKLGTFGPADPAPKVLGRKD